RGGGGGLGGRVGGEIGAARAGAPAGAERGIALEPLAPAVSEREIAYRHVRVSLDAERRTANVVVALALASDPLALGLQLARELDDALLRLRFHHPELGLWLLRVEGGPAHARALARALLGEGGLAGEVRALFGRVLKRLETSARSSFALVDRGTGFVGALAELALAADRIYLLRGGEPAPALELTAANRGAYPM